MKLLEREFIEEDGYWHSGGICVCGRILLEIFEIPDAIETIWISFHDRPSSLRLSGKVSTNPRGNYPAISFPEVILTKEDFRELVYSDMYADTLLKKFMGKLVHVQVEYEEQPLPGEVT